MNYNKIYFLKNFETEKTLTFSEQNISQEKLKEYNKQGWNIYESVNTFIGNKRIAKDIAEIKSCFIDIDYPSVTNLSESERATFMKRKFTEFLYPSLINIKELYGIFPNIINLTYKGFHILYDYDENCKFIDIEVHSEINKILNDILGGDENARDIARVYKVVGFEDNKNGKHGKIIDLKNKFGKANPEFLLESFITKEIIETKFKKSLILRELEKIKIKKDSKDKKESIKNTNIEKINSIDALVFLERLTTYFNSNKHLFSDENQFKSIENKIKFQILGETYKFYEDDGKTLTSGLMIEKDDKGLWKINDYSKKTRRGNYNFLKNWILNNKEFDYKVFIKILYGTTNLTLNSNLDKKAIIDGKLIYDLHRKNYQIDLTNEEKTHIERLDEENKHLFLKNRIENMKVFEIPGLNKVYYALFNYIKETNLKNNPNDFTVDNAMILKLKDFSNHYFGWNDKTYEKNKKQLILILEQIKRMEYPFENIHKLNNGKEIQTFPFKPIINLEYSNNKGGKGQQKLVFIRANIENGINSKLIFTNLPSYFNKNILLYNKGFDQNIKIVDLFLEINFVLENFNHPFKKSLKKIFKDIGYNRTFSINKFNLKKHLEKGKKLGFYKNYLFDENDNLIVSNFSALK